jgi:hypothetical protein
MPNNTSIVVTTTDGDKVVMKGKRIGDMLDSVQKAWGNRTKPYGWLISLTTAHTALPDTSIMGTYNDKPIRL